MDELEDVWKPFKAQKKFIQLPRGIRESFYGGAAGGGKSELLVLLPLLYGLYKHKNFKGIILRRTFPELEAEIILRAHQYYPQTGAVWDAGRKRYKWPAFNSYVSFGHAQREQDIRNYDGAEYQYVAFDELTSFTEFQYLYLVASRLRSTIPGLLPISRCASNPGNIGHGWVRNRFVSPHREGGRILLDPKTGHKRFFVPAKVTDNDYLMANDPGYIKALEMLPEAEKLAKLHGDWWTFTGQAFDDFRPHRLSDEPSSALHVIPDFEVPLWWPRLISMDWGHRAATDIQWGAVSPDSRLYIYRQFNAKGQKISDIANVLQQYEEEYDDAVLDWTAFEGRGEDKTIAHQLYEQTGLNFRKADKGRGSRVSGKILLQELFRWVPKSTQPPPTNYSEQTASEILRLRGLKSYNAYLDSFKPTAAETNLPKIQIFESCEKLVETLPLCVYAKDSDGNETEDVAEFEGDDSYDNLRYISRAWERFTGQSEKRQEKHQVLAQAHRRLEKTKDMTTFYRQCEVADRTQKQSPSFRRLRSRRMKRGY